MSVVEVPQAMAYAVIAGVSPVYGLYTSVIQGFLGSLFTSNEKLTTGPTNTHSLLTASVAVGLVSPGNTAAYLQTVLLLTFIKGIIQLICGYAGMGKLVRYVSQSVIIGFTAGAGVLIAVGQMPSFLGLNINLDISRFPGVIGDMHRLSMHALDLNARSIALGVVALVVCVGAKAIWRFLPGPLLAVLVAALLVWGMGWTEIHLPLTPDIPRVLPPLALPSLLTVTQPDGLISGALALAMLGMIETVAIGKAMAARTGQHIDADQEFIAQGLSNSLSSFLSCIPGTGSFTRSALNFHAGGRTRLAGISNAVFVAIIALVLAPMAHYIPLSALAAVLFVVAYGLIDWRLMLRIARSDRAEALVLNATLLAALLMPLKYAIFMGIFSSLAMFLRRVSRLHMAEMVTEDSGSIVERPLLDAQGNKSVIVLQVEGNLFFGVADELRERLTSVAQTGARVIVLRLKRAHSIDATILHELEQFTQMMRGTGRHVILCGIRPDLMKRMETYGLLDSLGRDNVFPAASGLFTSMKNAISRARNLVGASIDTTGLDMTDEQGNWYYQI